MNNFRLPSRTLIGRLYWQLFKSPALKANLDVLFMSQDQLRQNILRLIKAIRYHRDQCGDERCWFDDLWLYWHLPESVRYPVILSSDEMAAKCAYYHQYRQDDLVPRKHGQLDSFPDHSDYHHAMSDGELKQELCRLRRGIRKHKNIGMESRLVQDDKQLYALLPDGIEADFRLPPADLFLPNCRLICSKVDCKNVDLSQWPDGERSPLADWRPSVSQDL